MYPCPCCGYEVFDEPPGSFVICPICDWEDDNVQLAFPDMAGGANKCCLIDGQRYYAEYGANEPELVSRVRTASELDKRDPLWRPLDPESDRYLRWASREDLDLWQSIKSCDNPCLYYWRPEYWLKPKG